MDSSALYSDEYRKNPEVVWEEMRNDFPVFYDDISNMWWVTRYEDVKKFFAEYQTFSSSTYELTTGQVVGPTLISRDDYGHVVRRKVVAPDFVGNRLKSYEKLIEHCVNDLIDRFASPNTVSLVSEFSSQLPVDVISAILGMEGDGQLFRQWVTAMIMGLSDSPELRQEGLDANAAFCSHIAPLLNDVDQPQRTDHIAKIARAEIEGDRLTKEEITAFCGLLFIAGGETTDKAIANMWWNVLNHPETLEAVLADDSLWNNAFSETMRRTPAVISEERFTTRPVEIHGLEIPKGAKVRACLGAAHLDPTVFKDPLTFDIFRPDMHLGKENRSGVSKDAKRSSHFGFGLGKHFCIGYELARNEAVIGSQLILERLGTPRLQGKQRGPVIQARNSFFAVEELAVSFQNRA
jgi:cytochrome P450